MATPKQLRDAFRNPPRDGSGQGGPRMIDNSMGALPKPGCGMRLGYGPGGSNTESGMGLKQRREERKLEKMSPEDRQKHYMSKYDSSPPPATGPGAQTSLRESFEAGEMSARTNVRHSGRVEQAEFRNYDRGFVAPQAAGDPAEQTGPYDIAAAAEGDPHGRVT
jgi:hypothetical protein